MTWLDERTLRIARMLREPTTGRRGYTRRLHQVDPQHDGRASKQDELRLHRQPRPLVRFPGCRRPIKDLRGEKYGMLTVLGYAGHRGGLVMWYCQCDCGRIGVHAGKDMVSGHTQSCGRQRGAKGGRNADQEHQA